MTLESDFTGKMNDEKIKIAREIGQDISHYRIKIPCPVCLKDDPTSKDNPQLLASVGDFEEVLFCPHCDLNILLKVKQ